MQLAKKKELAAKVLGVGKGRIMFAPERLNEIKEAISKMDIIDLHKNGAISIRDVKGRKKIVRRKNRRRVGKIKQNVNTRKTEYVIITRKLRAYVRGLFRTGKINADEKREIRKQIRSRKFKNKRQLKEHLEDN
jgi:large subunit ribosomal protein L19e